MSSCTDKGADLDMMTLGRVKKKERSICQLFAGVPREKYTQRRCVRLSWWIQKLADSVADIPMGNLPRVFFLFFFVMSYFIPSLRRDVRFLEMSTRQKAHSHVSQ